MREQGSGPKTAAERQRAYRERKRAANDSVIAPPPGGEPPEDDAEVSIGELNARMRRMAMSAFDEVGGTEYLKKVAGKNPNTFLRFVGQFVTKDDSINPGAFNIFVQKLTVEAATPVPGVLASPVPGHIAPARMQLPPAMVVDEEGHDA